MQEPAYDLIMTYQDAETGQLAHAEALTEGIVRRFVESTHFESLRQSLAPNDGEPVFGRLVPRGVCADRCEMCAKLCGFYVHLAGPAGKDLACQSYPTDVLQGWANQTAVALAKRDGKLNDGEQTARYLYSLVARRCGETGPVLAAIRSAIRPIPLEEVPQTAGADARAPDFPLLVEQTVLDHILAWARQRDDAEVGGVLAGRLRFCPRRRDIWAHVSDAILAPAIGGKARLEFTPRAWNAVLQEISRRGGRDILGWWHSHPPSVAEAEPSLQGASKLFLSPLDMPIAEQHFSCPWMTSWVIDPELSDGEAIAAFGWASGVIAPRGYEVLSAPVASRGAR